MIEAQYKYKDSGYVHVRQRHLIRLKVNTLGQAIIDILPPEAEIFTSNSTIETKLEFHVTSRDPNQPHAIRPLNEFYKDENPTFLCGIENPTGTYDVKLLSLRARPTTEGMEHRDLTLYQSSRPENHDCRVDEEPHARLWVSCAASAFTAFAGQKIQLTFDLEGVPDHRRDGALTVVPDVRRGSDMRRGSVVMNTSITDAPAPTVIVPGCSERIIIVVSIVCAGAIVLIVAISCTAWVAIVRPRSRPDVELGTIQAQSPEVPTSSLVFGHQDRSSQRDIEISSNPLHGVQGSSSDAACNNLVPMTFHVFHDSAPQDAPVDSAVYLSGSLPSLGSWDLTRALEMKCAQNKNGSWALVVYIPEKTEFLFRYLRLQAPKDGIGSQEPIVLWHSDLISREATASPAVPVNQSVDVSSSVASTRARECVVCLEGKPVMALVPCGHRVLCESCHVGLQTCPICMTPVESVLKIFD